jgi:DNA mismatch repair ATPase MutS
VRIYGSLIEWCSQVAFSCVQIDELGRATASLDGVGICWSCAEALMRRPACYTLLATHFIELCQLPKLYRNVSNFHLQVALSAPGAESRNQRGHRHRVRMRSLFKVAPGQLDNEMQQYGIQLAQMAAFPADAIAHARQVNAQLQHFVSQQRAQVGGGGGGSVQQQQGHGRHGAVPTSLIPPSPLPRRASSYEVRLQTLREQSLRFRGDVRGADLVLVVVPLCFQCC